MPRANDLIVQEPAPSYVDTSKASVARVYDAALGGKDNYEIDRQVLQRLRRAAPEVLQIARDNRNFLIRTARFLASQPGIKQYLDCGSGLPTAENTHQVVQRVQPGARVVYVDNDPVVLAHGRALLEENNTTHFVDADIFRPERLMHNELVRTYLDFSEPIALYQNGTLHHHPGPPSPAEIMHQYIDALPSGSYVVISHFLDPEEPEYSVLARKIEEILLDSAVGKGWFRTRAEIESMFDGLELVEPGVTFCADWWPDVPRLSPLRDVQHCIAGGVGRKP